jgi:hypothetical protein
MVMHHPQRNNSLQRLSLDIPEIPIEPHDLVLAQPVTRIRGLVLRGARATLGTLGTFIHVGSGSSTRSFWATTTPLLATMTTLRTLAT